MKKPQLQLLFDRIAETGCHCPGDNPREPDEHTCLAGLAEQVTKALIAENKSLRDELDAEREARVLAEDNARE